MRLLPRARRIAFAAGLSLVIPAALLGGLHFALAGRQDGRTPGKSKGLEADPTAIDSAVFFYQRNPLPIGHERVPGLSPFGEAFREPRRPSQTRGLVATPLGFVDLKAPRGLDGLPPPLRRAARVERPGRLALARGPNYVQVPAAALAALGPAEIERRLGALGRLAGVAPERAFIVRIDDERDLEEIATLPFVESAMPYHPGLKIAPSVGRAPLVRRDRARSSVLELLIAAWPGADASERGRLRDGLVRIAGAASVADFSGDGSILRVDAPAARLAAIADLDEVAIVQEDPEWLLANAEAPSVVMAGSAEETLDARPFHDIGIDGGGIDTNGDGQRDNDPGASGDQVPPQIVAVTDNGLSLDSVQFSQSATEPFRPIVNPVGPRHRKVQAIQTVLDTGA
ncbi:MAG: hypothetical protein ACRD5D_04905, partial [Candidatus Polarisedimenticolia bacterium]